MLRITGHLVDSLAELARVHRNGSNAFTAGCFYFYLKGNRICHAKSTHFDVFIPLWLIFQPKKLINVMVIVSKSEDAANGLLGDIQAELEANQRIINDFGPQKSEGDWQEGSFVARCGVAFFSRGRGQSPRGLRYKEARPDYIVIDDLDDDELCRNERRVHEMTEWVKTALFGALDVGRGRFIMTGQKHKCRISPFVHRFSRNFLAGSVAF